MATVMSSSSSSSPKLPPAPPPSWALHAAFTALGLSSFMLSNALWAEMAAFIPALPEADKLGSYLLLSLQVANVVPAAAMLRGPEAMPLEAVIWTLLLGGILISQLMSFCWSYTTHTSSSNLNGNPHSIALILLTFLAGCINNSSSLYLYPFVARWERRYVSALATGEGLSGIMVSLLALAQNVGGTHPRFSTTVFFQGVSAFYIFSLLGFLFLLREQKLQETRKMMTTTTTTTARAAIGETNHASEIAAYKRLLLHQSITNSNDENTLALPLSSSSSSSSSLPPSPPKQKPVLRLIYHLLLAQFGISAWAYGVIPALTPISTRGYQHSGKILQFSSFVSMALDPLSRALTHYVRCYRLLLLFALVNFLAILLAVAAGMAPRPPFWEWEIGGVFVVVVNGGFTAAFAFCSTMIYFSIHLALQLQQQSEGGEDGEERREEGVGGGVVVAGAAAAFETLVVMKEEEEGEEEDGREEQDGLGSSRSGLVMSTPVEEEGREGGKEDEEKQRLEEEQVLRWQEGFRWSSFVIQIGAFVGALVTFLLVS